MCTTSRDRRASETSEEREARLQQVHDRPVSETIEDRQAVYKITAGHRSIFDHFTEMTVQIVAWSTLPSDHIHSCVSTLRKPADRAPTAVRQGGVTLIPTALPPATKGLDPVKGQDAILTPVNSQGDSLRRSMVKTQPPTGNHTFNNC